MDMRLVEGVSGIFGSSRANYYYLNRKTFRIGWLEMATFSLGALGVSPFPMPSPHIITGFRLGWGQIISEGNIRRFRPNRREPAGIIYVSYRS